jgi:hypothetical protein
VVCDVADSPFSASRARCRSLASRASGRISSRRALTCSRMVSTRSGIGRKTSARSRSTPEAEG